MTPAPLCAGMGVREYRRFLPRENDFGEGRDGIGIEGNSLARRGYVAIEPLRGRWVRSTVLGLDLRAEGPVVRFRGSETLVPLLHHEERVSCWTRHDRCRPGSLRSKNSWGRQQLAATRKDCVVSRRPLVAPKRRLGSPPRHGSPNSRHRSKLRRPVPRPRSTLAT